MPLTPTQMCGQLEAIKTSGLKSITGLTRKMSMLRSLASLLELSGDGIAIPDASALLPLSLINADVYTQIRAGCTDPLTGQPLLPPISGGNLSALQDTVKQGYQALLDVINSHPYGRMGDLQSLIDDLLNQASAPLGQAIGSALNVYGCLDSLCGGANVIAAAPANFSAAGQQIEANYHKTFPASGAGDNVLSNIQQSKANQLQNAKNVFQNLLSS